MADIIESTPADLNIESQVLKEKTIDEAVVETTEKGDADNTESEATKDTAVLQTAEVTDDTESTGIKRKSDDLVDDDIEESSGKKVKGSDDMLEEKGQQQEEGSGFSTTTHHDDKQPVGDEEEESNGKTHDHQEDVLKKSVEKEVLNPPAAEDIQA